LKTITREFAEYYTDLETIYEVRLDMDYSEQGDGYIFYCGSGNANYHSRTSFLYIGESYRQLVRI